MNLYIVSTKSEPSDYEADLGTILELVEDDDTEGKTYVARDGLHVGMYQWAPDVDLLPAPEFALEGLPADWWVDGHYVAATSPRDAVTEAAKSYGFTPTKVRPWTDADQADLDSQEG